MPANQQVCSYPPTCGRPGCALYADRPSSFTLDKPCTCCGYPGLKSLGNTCRHPQLRYIRNGPHAGKIGCLEPGCKALFEPHSRHPEFHERMRRQLKCILRGPERRRAGAWIAFAGDPIPSNDFEPWKDSKAGFFVAYFFADCRSPLYDLLKPANKEAEPPWDGVLPPAPSPPSRVPPPATNQWGSIPAQSPPGYPPPGPKTIVPAPPQVTACPPVKKPPAS